MVMENKEMVMKKSWKYIFVKSVGTLYIRSVMLKKGKIKLR